MSIDGFEVFSHHAEEGRILGHELTTAREVLSLRFAERKGCAQCRRGGGWSLETPVLGGRTSSASIRLRTHVFSTDGLPANSGNQALCSTNAS